MHRPLLPQPDGSSCPLLGSHLVPCPTARRAEAEAGLLARPFPPGSPWGAPVGPGVFGGLNTRVQTIVCGTGGRAVVSRWLEQTKEAQVALSGSLGLPFCLGTPQLQPQSQGVGGRG